MRSTDDPFEVRVYPRLGITPQPPSGTIKNPSSGALGRGERACTTFMLQEDFGTRIESAKGTPGFNVRAWLIADQATIDSALRDTQFTLDGEGIGFASAQPQSGGAWSQSKQRPVDALVRRAGVGGEHDLCVTLGPYADGDPLRPPTLRVKWVLDHAPYDHFDVIGEFQATVLIAKALGLSWSALVPFLLLAAGLLLALLRRPHLALPRDLGYAIATPSDPQRFLALPLPPPHPLRLWFGRRERQVVDAQGALLGWVRPQKEALYALRLAPGVRISHGDGTTIEPPRTGLYLLQVHQAYRLDSGGEGLWLRMQFT